MSREGKFVKNTIILAFGTFLPRFASFIIFPIITGYLTKAELGSYDLITVLESLLLPVVTLQIQTAAFRFLIDRREKEEEVKQIVSSIMLFALPISVVALIVLFFVLQLSALSKALICAYLLFDILANILRQIVRGLGMNHHYSVSAVLNSGGLMLGVVVFVYLLRMGLNGILIAMVIAACFASLYLLFFAKLFRYVDFGALNKKLLLEMLGYSWPMVPNSMSMWVMRLSDRIVVTLVMGVEWNAVYVVANKIPHLLTLAQTTFTMAWQENASIVVSDKDSTEYYSVMYRRIFRFMAGCMGALLAVTPLLYKLLVRGDYSDAIPQIPILIMAMFFASLAAYMGGIYVALMKTKSVGVTTVISAVINLVVNVGTIWFIGLYAASVSTLVSYIFLTVFRMFDIRKFVKLKYAWAEMGWIIAVLTLQCVLFNFQSLPAYLANTVIGFAMLFGLNMEIIRGMYSKAMQKLRKQHKN